MTAASSADCADREVALSSTIVILVVPSSAAVSASGARKAVKSTTLAVSTIRRRAQRP